MREVEIRDVSWFVSVGVLKVSAEAVYYIACPFSNCSNGISLFILIGEPVVRRRQPMFHFLLSHRQREVHFVFGALAFIT
jgi:hypothetical protein